MANEVLVIKGSEWYRGLGGDDSLLHAADGRFCCLGLDAVRCGVPVDLMDECVAAEPIDIARYDEELDESVVDVPVRYAHWLTSADTNTVIQINDNPHISDGERIEALRPIFAKHGIVIDWQPNE